jgi:hypothetical protein
MAVKMEHIIDYLKEAKEQNPEDRCPSITDEMLDRLILECKTYIPDYKYKVGQRIEFWQKGMDPLLHGKIVKVCAGCVIVRCKNGCERYPEYKDIIRIC